MEQLKDKKPIFRYFMAFVVIVVLLVLVFLAFQKLKKWKESEEQDKIIEKALEELTAPVSENYQHSSQEVIDSLTAPGK